ncbi:hypothetical protein [uncultured Roseobacter sp.]|uniref:hypothetical protein n=1 Tax=uncultured Roseobacter sp. TaxID=114847 RepID=UPI002609335C|nr:hypothetical protein [uncultured Roseobacter sp.]
MINTNIVAPLPSDLSDRVLTVNLTLKADRVVHVRSCEVLGRGFRNRISFQHVGELDEVFVTRLADAIRNCIRSVPTGAHVLSLPEFLVEVPGLALSGVHLLVMEANDGVRNAILRFKEFMGSINNAFHADIGFQAPYSNHAERLAANVLADICLPLLNMCRDLEYGQHDTRDRLPTGFSERAREFEFHTELLKRFIYHAGIGHAAGTEAHLSAEHQPQPRQLPPV